MASLLPLDVTIENAQVPLNKPGGSIVLPAGPPCPLPNHSTAVLNDPILASLLRLGWSSADKDGLLSTFRVLECTARSKDQLVPPFDTWGCEDPVAAQQWRDWMLLYNQAGKAKDKRRKAYADVTDISENDFDHVIEHDENTILVDEEDGSIVGFVMYDFLPNGREPGTLAAGLLKYLDNISLKLGAMVRDARRDDRGRMSCIGYTAGQRAARYAGEPCMRIANWCKSVIGKTHTTGHLRQCIHEATSCISLFWSAAKAVLPVSIVSDFEGPMLKHELPRMDWNTMGDPPSNANVSVEINGQSYEFDTSTVELGPPHAVCGMNYARYTHYEHNDNTYVVSLTTSRNASKDAGRHFYYAKYGVLVRNRTNTLIVQRGEDAHGTLLPHRAPETETAKGASVEQNGFSMLLPTGFCGAWRNHVRFRDGHVAPRKDARLPAATDSETREESRASEGSEQNRDRRKRRKIVK